MAQVISFPPPHDIGSDATERLQRAPLEHTDAIVSALELLQVLHDNGILELLRGMVGAGNQIVDIAASRMNSPEAVRAIRNFLLLTKFFASIPPEVLHSLVETAVNGAEREKAHGAPGLVHLLRRLNSENSRHALSVMADLVESVGRGL